MSCNVRKILPQNKEKAFRFKKSRQERAPQRGDRNSPLEIQKTHLLSFPVDEGNTLSHGSGQTCTLFQPEDLQAGRALKVLVPKCKLLLLLTGNKAIWRATSDLIEDQHAQERRGGLSRGKNIRAAISAKVVAQVLPRCGPDVTWTEHLGHKDSDFGASSAQVLHGALANLGKQSPGVKPVATPHFGNITITSRG